MRGLLLILLLVNMSCSGVISMIGGDFKGPPENINNKISKEAQALIKKAFEGIDRKKLVDFHVHLVGVGAGGTGAFVNPEMQSYLHPLKLLRFNVYRNASKIDDLSKGDQEYVTRLNSLVDSIPNHGRYQLLAFDKHYDPNGKVNLHLTEFYTPNEYAFKIYEQYPDKYLPTISIHPYREDAIQKLEKYAKRGAKMIKWLPNSMGIDPANPKIIPYYKKVKELDLVILTHTGLEKAVDAEEYQKFGNPLRFRLPLDMGVKIVMAHLASSGDDIDIDLKESEKDPEKQTSFELFMRLMDEKKYENNLWGEISAITQFNRYGRALKLIIEREDLHHRLINGSDYPLPAINLIIQTKKLKEAGFLTVEEMNALEEIYSYNPLLFDFVVKRTIKHPETKKKLSAKIFESPWDF